MIGISGKHTFYIKRSYYETIFVFDTAADIVFRIECATCYYFERIVHYR